MKTLVGKALRTLLTSCLYLAPCHTHLVCSRAFMCLHTLCVLIPNMFCTSLWRFFWQLSIFMKNPIQCTRNILIEVNLYKSLLNPFSTNVPLMQKPGSWFLIEKYLKNTCGRVIDLHLYLKYHSSKAAFQIFANKDQLPGLSVSGTLVKYELRSKQWWFPIYFANRWFWW